MGSGLGLGLGRASKCRGPLIDTRIFELEKFVVELKVLLPYIVIKPEPEPLFDRARDL